MQNNRKKPIMINLVAALIACLVTFIIGCVMSNFVFLDSKLEDAQDKISELNEKLSEKNTEIKDLNSAISQKDENNAILAENLQAVAAENDKLTSQINSLKQDVNSISEAAINGTVPVRGSLFDPLKGLSVTQQLIVLVILLVVLVLIISISCAYIASKTGTGNSKKRSKTVKAKKDKPIPPSDKDDDNDVDVDEPEEDIPEYTAAESAESAKEETSEELTPSDAPVLTPSSVDEAIDLLYHNNLEDSISDLGGFKFGITNFDDVLSDKAHGKAFGNSESGDFVAFMSTAFSVKRLYIIPRYMTLSDSTVALRGTVDLFNITDEGGNKVTGGTVRIKSIDSPAIFACGANGWSIEVKGNITSLGDKSF